MNAVQMVISLYLTLATLIATNWFRRLESWHSDVVAMHLHWNRVQQQAAPIIPTLEQRQSAQVEFEDVTARKPVRSGWTVLAIVLVLLVFGILIGIENDAGQWVVTYLFVPIVLVWGVVLAASIQMLRDGQRRMQIVATTLYPRPQA